MGVQEEVIKAELYKLLVYDPGAFFLRHRDTEKSPGMFGTLVIVLPSEHAGGELVVSHGEKEVTVSLANNEVSAIRFAAVASTIPETCSRPRRHSACTPLVSPRRC